MYNGLNGNGYQPIPSNNEFSGWDEEIRGQCMAKSLGLNRVDVGGSMKTIELTEDEVEIILELLGNANPTWGEDTEKVYSLWQRIMEIENEES